MSTLEAWIDHRRDERYRSTFGIIHQSAATDRSGEFGNRLSQGRVSGILNGGERVGKRVMNVRTREMSTERAIMGPHVTWSHNRDPSRENTQGLAI